MSTNSNPSTSSQASGSKMPETCSATVHRRDHRHIDVVDRLELLSTFDLVMTGECTGRDGAARSSPHRPRAQPRCNAVDDLGEQVVGRPVGRVDRDPRDVVRPRTGHGSVRRPRPVCHERRSSRAGSRRSVPPSRSTDRRGSAPGVRAGAHPDPRPRAPGDMPVSTRRSRGEPDSRRRQPPSRLRFARCTRSVRARSRVLPPADRPARDRVRRPGGCGPRRTGDW